MSKSLIIKSLKDSKAHNIVSLDVRKMTVMCDTMIVSEGTSSRHIKTIAEKLITAAKKAGLSLLGCEGMENAEWILIDLDVFLVHIMLKEQRKMYALEDLWDEKFAPPAI